MGGIRMASASGALSAEAAGTRHGTSSYRTGRRDGLPTSFKDVEELEAFLSEPDEALIADLAALDGDILILGVAGKMGPTLARMARNAASEKRIIGVARFSEAGLRERLESFGVETIAADLLDEDQVKA